MTPLQFLWDLIYHASRENREIPSCIFETGRLVDSTFSLNHCCISNIRCHSNPCTSSTSGLFWLFILFSIYFFSYFFLRYFLVSYMLFFALYLSLSSLFLSTGMKSCFMSDLGQSDYLSGRSSAISTFRSCGDSWSGLAMDANNARTPEGSNVNVLS